MFDEVRLPPDVERGATGGPRFKTTVIGLSSGHEQRNIDWSQVKSEFDIGYGIQSISRLEDVIKFFYARRGRARGFRFKDWADYRISTQPIGVGDGINKTFQIFKRYTSGGVDYDRTINKIVSGTTTVFVNEVAQTTGVSVNENTGLITFTTAPAEPLIVSVTCEFDIPVRFDTDKLDINVLMFQAGSIPSIPVVELRQS